MMTQYLKAQTLGEQQLKCPGLPLAIYREVEAHLQQVQDIEVKLLPQTSQTFNYGQSQAGGLHIRYTGQLSKSDLQKIEAILKYYGDRYGVWQALTV